MTNEELRKRLAWVEPPATNRVFVWSIAIGTIVLAHIATAQHWTVATSAVVMTLYVVAVSAVARQRVTRTQWLMLGAWVVVNVLITLGRRI